MLLQLSLPLLLLLPLIQRGSTADTKPNILLLVIDDLGWNDTGYQGADYATPTFDRLTNEGIRLKQYYVHRLCTPSRAALLAGRYAYNLGLDGGVITDGHPFALNLTETIMAKYLKDGGYSTHAVGKWDLGMHKWEYTPTYRGFDTFYGYYNADEDYFTHNVTSVYIDPATKRRIRANGVDLRNNKDPVLTENGNYSTNLYTGVIQQLLTSHDSKKGPFFIYGAYQAMHSPLEVPDQYLDGCNDIPYPNRKIFCGMMKALDEGINNITQTLDKEGYLDNTVIILTTDNGGQTAQGSSNLPLRGNKATIFEGGLRGFGFVWSKLLKKTNFDYNGLMHITDWYPTIVKGIAGIELDKQDLDGYDMWDALNTNKPSPRNEILLCLNPPRTADHYMGQAAIRVGDWKLITGRPNTSKSNIEVPGDLSPTGWVYLNGSIEIPPPNPTWTWLFNLTNDPNERNDLSSKHPDVVSGLKKKIEVYNTTHIVQLNPPFDPRSDPRHFNGVWTPWLD